ncbi:MAG: hypothetical protein MUF44_16120 [Hydrogenophaga sp.]|jgi:hypothetical protein|nr:hypothetical protein [Hydrogenophaga sp.]
MTLNLSARFMRLKAQIQDAGGFGDGLDTSEYDVNAELGNRSYTQPQRVEVSVALLAELASAIDNSDWASVRTSKLARAARLEVSEGWLSDELLSSAVRALDESELSFYTALAEVYAVHVQEPQDGPHLGVRGQAAGDA